MKNSLIFIVVRHWCLAQNAKVRIEGDVIVHFPLDLFLELISTASSILFSNSSPLMKLQLQLPPVRGLMILPQKSTYIKSMNEIMEFMQFPR